MSEGIAIVGLNGSGRSTLGHALAKELNYYEIDVEDYYFPEQRSPDVLCLMECMGKLRLPGQYAIFCISHKRRG